MILKGGNSNNKPSNRFNKNESKNTSCRTIKPFFCNSKPSTKANLHELFHELIVEINESEEDDLFAKDASDNNDSTLLVNSATANEINPRDIRQLFSILIKGNSVSSSTKKIFSKSEININGKIYLEVGNHIIYFLSKVSRS